MTPSAQRPPGVQLRALSAFYFCVFGALGTLFPFLPIMLGSRGLGALQISWVMVLIPLSSMILPPLWGASADALRARAGLLGLLSLGSAAGVLLLLPATSLPACLGAMLVFCLFRAGLAGLADASTHSALGPQRHRFARVRVWGSVGYALLASLLGQLNAGSRPLLLFGTCATLYLLAALSTRRIGPVSPGRAPEFGRALGAVLRHPRIALLLVGNGFYYAGHGAFDVYYGLHLQHLGHGDDTLGLAWGIGVGSETALMLAAPALLRARSARNLLPACAVIAALRWFLVGTLRTAAALLLIQPLHAITFGLWYLSLAKQVQDASPEALRASFQGVNSASVGFGGLLGYLGGGALFQATGGPWTFRAAACAAVVAATVYGLASVRNPS